MNSLSSAVSVILFVLMTKVCIIRGSCSNRQTSDCCNPGYFYDSVSRKCMDCPNGFTGENCSFRCRYPSYGYRCQSACDCFKENCDASTGCILNTHRIPTKNDALSATDGSLVYASDQETESVSESKQINLDTKRSPDVAVTPVLITVVVVLLVVLAAIVSRYTWRKYVVRRENGENRGKNSVKDFEEFLNRKSCNSDETNENLYDELDEKKMDASKVTNEKGPKTVDKTLQNDYIDSLALKKRQSDRESKHFYDPLK